MHSEKNVSLLNRKLSVVWLIDGNESYGLKTIMVDLARSLISSASVDLKIIANVASPLCSELESLGCGFVSLDIGSFIPIRTKSGSLSIWNAFRELLRLCRIALCARRELLRLKPDILHTHAAHCHITGMFAARNLNIPVIWHWHGPYCFTGLVNRAFSRLAKYVTRMCCISGFVLRSLPDRFQSKAEVIYNGTDLDSLRTNCPDNFRRVYGIPRDVPLIGTFGSVIERKGFRYFVEAAAQLASRFSDIRFAVVGGPSPVSEDVYKGLVQQSHEAGLEGRLTFTGPLGNARSKMGEFDVIVVPTIPYHSDPGEGFGLILIECMAAGVPPVATNIGAFPEIIEDNVSGILVPPMDGAAICNSVERLIVDKELRKSIGHAARRRVELAFSIQRMARDMILIYQQLATGGTGK